MSNIQDNRHFIELGIRLGDVTLEMFYTLFERVHTTYNADLTLGQVEWTFYIDQETLQIGGGGGFGKSKEMLGLYPLTCQEYGDVSCAALAITFWMIMKSGKDEFKNIKNQMKRKSSMDKWLTMGNELQLKMGWGKQTTLADVGDVVKHIYTDYRLVIINPMLKKSDRCVAYGRDYIQEEDRSNGYKNTIYLFFDYQKNHFCTISSPTEFCRKFKKDDHLPSWCHECLACECDCVDGVAKKAERKRKRKTPCNKCGHETYGLKNHDCGERTCTACYKEYKFGKADDHRCAISIARGTIPVDYLSGDEKAKQLWCYDFESMIVIDPNDDTSLEFYVDDEGYYHVESEGERCPVRVACHKQVVNFACYRNVFTGERRETNDIREFTEDILFRINKGNNDVFAHNASGYDSRLLFEVINDIAGVQNTIIAKGTKLMRMQVGKTVFKDSMLHLQGALAALGHDYLGHLGLVKGYFPHLFNTPENQNYVGKIPDKKYFDITSIHSNEKALQKFFAWYETVKDTEDWDFQEEMKKYCRLDVDILAAIMKIHHTLVMEEMTKYEPRIAISPWHYTTTASYIHKLILYDLEFKEGQEKGERGGLTSE